MIQDEDDNICNLNRISSITFFKSDKTNCVYAEVFSEGSFKDYEIDEKIINKIFKMIKEKKNERIQTGRYYSRYM